MTLPDERTKAVVYTKAFLRSLLDPKQTPKVPKAIRRQAAMLLKHYPDGLDMAEAVNKAPKVFGKYRP